MRTSVNLQQHSEETTNDTEGGLYVEVTGIAFCGGGCGGAGGRGGTAVAGNFGARFAVA